MPALHAGAFECEHRAERRRARRRVASRARARGPAARADDAVGSSARGHRLVRSQPSAHRRAAARARASADVSSSSVQTSGMKYSEVELGSLYQRLLETARQSPDVDAAALATTLPFYTSWAVRVRVPGRDSLPRVRDGGPYINEVTPGYFANCRNTDPSRPRSERCRQRGSAASSRDQRESREALVADRKRDRQMHEDRRRQRCRAPRSSESPRTRDVSR